MELMSLGLRVMGIAVESFEMKMGRELADGKNRSKLRRGAGMVALN